MNLVESEEQDKKMKSIAFQEQVQKEESESETRGLWIWTRIGFSTCWAAWIYENTLGRAGCVNSYLYKALA